ncbi:hypothetical protein M8J77_004167 [Diaphorina citri]|nr:hypothetical protein M8J77_004167 [Diaphorina citri]
MELLNQASLVIAISHSTASAMLTRFTAEPTSLSMLAVFAFRRFFPPAIPLLSYGPVLLVPCEAFQCLADAGKLYHPVESGWPRHIGHLIVACPTEVFTFFIN